LIEQAIFAAVGFLAATLLALATAPAVTSRARRLASARARLIAPLSEAQAVADRDALRALHALDIHRLERRLAAAEEDVATRRAELGRQITRNVMLEESTVHHGEELAAALRESEELVAALGATQLALFDLAAQRERANVARGEAEAYSAEIEMLFQERRAEIATLETRIVALEERATDAERAAATAASRAAFERESLAAALSEAETRLAHAEAAREEAVLENRRQLARLADRDDALVGGASTAVPRAEGDKALRAAIARLGRDIARLEGRRRIVEPEPISLPSIHPAPAGKIRQGEPAAREG
jgi:chromosome segregation ATPase